MLQTQDIRTALPTRLLALREKTSGVRLTSGLDDDTVAMFAASDAALQQAIDDAWQAAQTLREEQPALFAADESEQIAAIHAGIFNFYADDAVNPYVALAARGPWIVTTKGAVLHDSGGYGMLGFGHSPEQVLAAMSGRQVMANVMTPSFSQRRLIEALRAEIAHGRACPFDNFVFLNSGSEAVTLGLRIADVNSKIQTDPGGAHAGAVIRSVGLRQGFHGRTDRPGQYSDSTLSTYTKHLASFRDRPGPITVEPNNVAQLQQAFASAQEQGYFIEALTVEPVMGEGNPGLAMTREFYDAARKLTRDNDALLLVDSIQAGLRAHGCLSIVDYPGFAGCEAPDIETYSKAVNAGQYPLSVVALNPRATALCRKGIYGNTMTSNPRAMDVAVAVLSSLTPELRENIRARGAQFVAGLKSLADELGDAITGVQGTGLLVSCELNKQRYKAFGAGSSEEYMRKHGIGVVHGGQHSLRFTPPFTITAAEVDMIVSRIRDALINGPQK